MKNRSSPGTIILVLFMAVAMGVLLWRQSRQGAAHPAPTAQQDGVAVYFSPLGGCEDAVVSQIHSAQKTIDMQAYSFTSKPIAAALVDAQSRGVHVRAILDKKDSIDDKYNLGTYLIDNHVPTFLDGAHAIAHNKIIIIDGKTVVTGSFNFTNQAEHSNAENLVILMDKQVLADAYEHNFEEHLGHSLKQ